MEDTAAYYALVDDRNIVKKCIPFTDDTEFERIRRTIPVELVDGTWRRVTTISKIPDRGWMFSPAKNAFYPPRPYPSWILGEDLEWKAPVPVPEEECCEGLHSWVWDEETRTWVVFHQ